MKKGDEVQVIFTGRLMRKPSDDDWASVQVRIGGDVFHPGTFIAVVPARCCRVLEADED